MAADTFGSGCRFAVLLGLISGLAACSGSQSAGSGSSPGALSLTGPGGTSEPFTTTVRYYKTAFTAPAGASMNAGTSTDLTLTVTNCGGSNPCGTSNTNNNQKIGSGTITVPSGFTINGSITLGPPSGKLWHATFDSGTGIISLEANNGTYKLEIGESLTVSFNATAPCANGSPAWETHFYQDLPLPTPPAGTKFDLVGSPAAITVTGSCSRGCTFSQGHWKNSPNSWPVSTVTLGTVSYSEADALSIFGEPVGGNGLISLAHQLIAAKLNIASGADGSSISSTITAADALIGGLVVPPVGSGSLAPNLTSTLTTALDNYNNGVTGPGHCPE